MVVTKAPWIWTLLCLIIALASSSVNEEFQPKISKLKEDSVAKAYSYFDDSSTILGSRKSKLIISFDDGKSWQEVKETKDEEIIHYQVDLFLRERASPSLLIAPSLLPTTRGRLG